MRVNRTLPKGIGERDTPVEGASQERAPAGADPQIASVPPVWH